MYGATLPGKVTNYSELYGWVEESGPYNENERLRAEQRLRVIGFPRDQFTADETRRSAAEIRTLGLADVRRHRIEELERARSAAGDRVVAVVMTALGAGGICFYLWLGCVLMRESSDAPRDPRTTWLGRKRRHGRITFGRIQA
jgi:hypothetical protein